MKTQWSGKTESVDNQDHARVLADKGVFDEAEAMFAAVERGENPFADYEAPHKLVERLRLQRPE